MARGPSFFTSLRIDSGRLGITPTAGHHWAPSGNRVGVDIQTNKSYLAHDRLLRMWLCGAVLQLAA